MRMVSTHNLLSHTSGGSEATHTFHSLETLLAERSDAHTPGTDFDIKTK